MSTWSITRSSGSCVVWPSITPSLSICHSPWLSTRNYWPSMYVCMHRMVQMKLICRVSLLVFELFLFSLLSLHVVIAFIFRSPSFKDFMQLFPSMAKSIEEILQYSGNNFEEVFDLNFTVNKDCQCRSMLLSVIYAVQGILEELRACALLQLILLTMTEVITIM